MGCKARTEKLALEVLLHCVVIANENISTERLIAWEHFGGGKGFEALVVAAS
jgi:hypothetical protein